MVSMSSLDIDTPSLLIGVGAGLGGFKFVTGSILAGTSILLIAGVPLAVGVLKAKSKEATE